MIGDTQNTVKPDNDHGCNEQKFDKTLAPNGYSNT